MKKSRFTEAQIMVVLRQAEGAVPVAEPMSRTRHDAVAQQAFCAANAERGREVPQMAGQIWRMDASMISRMKPLEDENRHRADVCGPQHTG
jgi:putative transposase